jgi:molybdopterin converting factor subunit 1
MRIRVRLFAAAKERAKASSLEVTVPPPQTVGALLEAVGHASPALRSLLPQLRVAVNEAFAEPNTVLAEADEVALIPPVSGG